MNGCMVMDVALQKRIERRIYSTGENDAKTEVSTVVAQCLPHNFPQRKLISVNILIL